MMEFLTGVKEQETLELTTLLAGDYEGQSVKLNGAVHTIRDMGEVAFVILRKREGLIQCVFEEGVTRFELKDLKEAATVEVEGVVAKEDRAPNGIEIRLREIRILSEPSAPMPLAISKWKLNTSLEAVGVCAVIGLGVVFISLDVVDERAGAVHPQGPEDVLVQALFKALARHALHDIAR